MSPANRRSAPVLESDRSRRVLSLARARVHRARRAGVVAVAGLARGHAGVVGDRPQRPGPARGARPRPPAAHVGRPRAHRPRLPRVRRHAAGGEARRSAAVQPDLEARMRQAGSVERRAVDGVARAVARAEVRQLRPGAGAATARACAASISSRSTRGACSSCWCRPTARSCTRCSSCSEPISPSDLAQAANYLNIEFAGQHARGHPRRHPGAPAGRPGALRPTDGARADAGVEHARRRVAGAAVVRRTAMSSLLDEAGAEEGALPIAALRAVLGDDRGEAPAGAAARRVRRGPGPHGRHRRRAHRAGAAAVQPGGLDGGATRGGSRRVGVLGPTRMRYSRTIAAVESAARAGRAADARQPQLTNRGARRVHRHDHAEHRSNERPCRGGPAERCARRRRRAGTGGDDGPDPEVRSRASATSSRTCCCARPPSSTTTASASSASGANRPSGRPRISLKDLLPVLDDLERAARADAGDRRRVVPQGRRADRPAVRRRARPARRQRHRPARARLHAARARGRRCTSRAPAPRDGEVVEVLRRGYKHRRPAAAAGHGEGGVGVSTSATTTRCSASSGRRPTRRSRAPTASSRSRTTPTATRATRPPRSASRKPPRRTPCSPTPTSARPTTASATPASAPAARADRASTRRSSPTSTTSSAASATSSASATCSAAAGARRRAARRRPALRPRDRLRGGVRRRRDDHPDSARRDLRHLQGHAARPRAAAPRRAGSAAAPASCATSRASSPSPARAACAAARAA